MRWLPGLVSISFRSLTPDQILSLSVQAGLKAIEWGSDVHVPAGDIETARRVGDATRAAGLCIPAYGSYYKIGLSDEADFSGIAACARALDTDHIRVWAYHKNPEDIAPEIYAQIVADARRICKAVPDMTICLECHNNTLTSNPVSALKFLEDTACKNLKMFWQPNQLRTHEENLLACKALLPYIEHIHVFSWEGSQHFPLAHHTERWQDYLDILRDGMPAKIPLMLEFMHDHQPETLSPTAKTLLDWIEKNQ